MVTLYIFFTPNYLFEQFKMEMIDKISLKCVKNNDFIHWYRKHFNVSRENSDEV